MSKQLALSLNNVGTFYWRQAGYLRKERFWALKNVSFDLHHGESLGVIGRNGAGKSTLLQVLAGILRPDRGKMINHGVQAALLSLQIGFVPYLTGRQNALLSGMLIGLHRKNVIERMEDIQNFSELGEFFDQPISTYSSGMKARLGFSVAFQLDPDVLLIDEVLGVGDSDFQRKSSAIMHEKIRSDKTIVLVSHSVETIRKLCDRAVWIEDGISHAYGDTFDVLSVYEKQQSIKS
ncbi:MAG TPA: ABC transporter ATP-binding protein [Candidatus Competibacter sp.]|jgi:lipopolysaccharide transport system ATP-binding protein|nr:ABC transporter ATP-binding protein [Candidatus Competibacteraceae bacterium]HRW64193.1 ABC transporter ATP-binding protein [Candidatus Competibacter sp.]